MVPSFAMSLTTIVHLANGSSGTLTEKNTCSKPTLITPETIDQKRPAHSPLCAVSFRVCITTQFYESVRVVGSCPELGNWDATQGVELVTHDSMYPCWVTSRSINLPIRQQIDYKYVIFDPRGVICRWEDYSGNRQIIPTGLAMTIEDDEGFGRTLVQTLPKTSGEGKKQPDENIGSTTANQRYLAFRQSLMAARRSQGISQTQQGRLDNRPDERLDTRHLTKESFPDMLPFDEPTVSSWKSVSKVYLPMDSKTFGANGTSRRLPSDAVKELQEVDSIPTINENDTLVIVSFELPMRVIRTDIGTLEVEKQKSLLMPQLHALRHSVRVPVKFIGWAGLIPSTDEEKHQIEELLEPYDCIPVHLTEENVDLFLNFCHQCLWPLFHNVVVLHSYNKRPFNPQQWVAYQNVNRQFADIVIHGAHESDLIWIHDYYLLLVPQFITRRIRKANVGLFLHVPFPSSEVFRCIPVREEILRGMLCADLIGFHFFEYARHFLVVNKRLLGLDHHFRMGGFLELDYGGRNVMVRIGHVHVQYDELRRIIEASDEVKSRSKKIKNRFPGRFLFVSVDRCERLAGIILKLQGFQNFLRNYPYAQTRALLLQYAYPTVNNWDNQHDYYEELKSLANEINSEFARGPAPQDQAVLIKFRSISPAKKYALFQSGDCLLSTSVRDGLNLSPFEFICCRKDDPAPLILSEFTGCCRTLASAIRINPWKAEDVSQAMDRAMHPPSEEMKDRFLRDQMYLQRNSTLQWAEEFLLDLRRARKREDLVYVSWGFGTSYRVFGVDSQFQYLNCDHVIQAFKEAKRPVLFFDHEGTLAPDRRRITAVPGLEALTATGSAPSAQIRQCLTSLCSAGMIVVILSGRDRNLLDNWFGNIEGIGLCAEHGFYYKVPQVSGNRWQSILASDTEDFTWKEIATELMKQYVKRTQGAFIENKGSALVFQYRDADPDFGSWQAKELSNYLQELLFGCPVTVMSGKGYVEVKLSGVNKGQAISTVLKKITEQQSTDSVSNQVDFILCIGDDRSDEDMFPVVNSFFNSSLTANTSNLRLSPLRTASHIESSNTSYTTGTHASTTWGNNSLDPDGPFIKRAYTSEEFGILDDSTHNELLSPNTTKLVGSHHLSRPFPFNRHKSRTSSSSSSTKLGQSGFSRPTLPICFSVTVGKKPSNARYYVNDIEEVSELLQALGHYASKIQTTESHGLSLSTLPVTCPSQQ